MKLLHEELTYRIRGMCYKVHNDYGGGHKEVIYQRALEEKLSASGVPFLREPKIAVRSKDSNIQLGWYQPDFVIADRIVVEIKALPFVTRQATYQLVSYLRHTPYELGLLINFSPDRCDIKRVLDATKYPG